MVCSEENVHISHLTLSQEEESERTWFQGYSDSRFRGSTAEAQAFDAWYQEIWYSEAMYQDVLYWEVYRHVQCSDVRSEDVRRRFFIGQ